MDPVGVVGGFLRGMYVLEDEDAVGMRDEPLSLYIACWPINEYLKSWW